MALIKGKQIFGNSVNLGKIDWETYTVGDAISGVSADKAPINKAYADSLAAGLDYKGSCQVGTIADLGATYASSGANGAPASGEFTGDVPNTIDGIVLTVGMRVLVKDQIDPLQNGIYEVTDIGVGGAGGSTTSMQRAVDHDGSPTNEVSGGNSTFVEQGTVNASVGYVLEGSGDIILNTDPLNWIQFSSVGSFTGGDGISIAGQIVSVDLDTNSGLEFNTGALRILNSSGITRDAAGISVDLAYLADNLATENLAPTTPITVYSDAGNQLFIDEADLTAITASNGLTRTGDDIELGGLLTSATTIDLDNFSLAVDDTANSHNDIFTISNAGGIDFDGQAGDLNFDVTGMNNLNLDGAAVAFKQTDATVTQIGLTQTTTDLQSGGGTEQIEIADAGITVTSAVAGAMQYAADYSGTFVDESIVTKRYVDAQVTGSALTNGSGTTANGTAVDLGGVLSSVVNIDGSASNFDYVVGFNNDVGVFDVNSDGNITLDSSSGTFSASGTFTNLNATISAGIAALSNSVQVNGGGVGLTVSSSTDNITNTLAGGANDFIVDIQAGGVIDLNAGGAASSFDLSIDNGTDTTTFIIDAPLAGATSAVMTSASALFAGIEYGADYSGNYSNRSLVDKEYVDTQLSGAALTFQNGLTETTGTVELGGSMTADINLTRDASAAHTFELQQANDSGNGITTYFQGIQMEGEGAGSGANNFLTLYSKNGSQGTSAPVFGDATSDPIDLGSYIRLQDAGASTEKVVMGHSSLNSDIFVKIINAGIEQTVSGSGNTTTFSMTPIGATFTSPTVTTAGIQYGADYSGNYTARSLVDRDYVDTSITASQVGSGSGITIATNQANLGGALTADATLTGVFDVNVGTSGSPIDTFNMYAESSLGFGIGTNHQRIETIDNAGNVEFRIEAESNGGLARVRLGNGGDGELEMEGSATVRLNAPANQSILTNAPTGTVANAIATTGYVDNAVSTGVTSGEGITVTGGQIDLGGTYASDLNVDSTTVGTTLRMGHSVATNRYGGSIVGTDNSGYNPSAGNAMWASTDSTFVDDYADEDGSVFPTTVGSKQGAWAGAGVAQGGGIYSQMGSTGASSTSEILMQSGGYAATVRGASGNTFQSISNTGMIIGSTFATFQGAQYQADYSTNFVDRSLVDKGYVDAAITGVTLGNGSGTTFNTGAIDLGGTLTSNAIVSGAFDVRFGEAAGTEIVDFEVGANGNIDIATSNIASAVNLQGTLGFARFDNVQATLGIDAVTNSTVNLTAASVDVSHSQFASFGVDAVTSAVVPARDLSFWNAINSNIPTSGDSLVGGGEIVVGLNDTSTFFVQSTDENKKATIIGSRNSIVDEGVVNSVILGGQDQVAIASNTVYTPNMEVSGNTRFLGGNLQGIGLSDLDFTIADARLDYLGGALRLLNNDGAASSDSTNIQVRGDQLIMGTSAGASSPSGNPGNTNLIINAGGDIVFTDTAQSKGVIYAADYSANFVDRSLVDKGYVDTEISTAVGGISTGIDDVLSQGQSLTATRTVDLAGNFLNFSSTEAGQSTAFQVTLEDTTSQTRSNVAINDNGNIGLTSTDVATTAFAQVQTDTTGVDLRFNDGTNSQEINLRSADMRVIDGINSKGLEYFADYSTNFTARSLVDKGYVDAQITATSSLQAALNGGRTADLSGSAFQITFDAGLDSTLELGETSGDFRASTFDGAGFQFNTNGTPANNYARMFVEGNGGDVNRTLQVTSGTGLTYTDDSNLIFTADANGLSYAANYAAANAANDRWLVDKGYVDAQVGGVGTGIDDVLSQGQALTTNRTIDIDGNNFAITDTSGSAEFNVELNDATYEARLQLQNDATPLAQLYASEDAAFFAGFQASNTNINMTWDNDTDVKSIVINNSGMTVTDAISSAGLVYAADYSAANVANDRWIVDKAYVDTAVAGATLSNGSGTTFNTGAVDLGGALTSQANIGVSNFNFRLFGDDGTNSANVTIGAAGMDAFYEDSNNSDNVTSVQHDFDSYQIVSDENGGGGDRSFFRMTPSNLRMEYGTSGSDPFTFQLSSASGFISGAGSSIIADNSRARLIGNDNSDGNGSVITAEETNLTLEYTENAATTPTVKSIVFNNAGMTVTDETDLAGLSYAADYSAANAANDRWIVDKAYVDSAIGSSGLANVADGTGNEVLLGSDSEASNLTLTTRSSLTNANLIINAKGIGNILANNDVLLIDGSAASPSLGFQSEANTGIFRSGAGNFDIAVSGNPVLNVNANGALYAADYSSTFTARSLVDKEYVDGIAAGISAKEPARAKTTSALPAYTQAGSGAGATLTADVNGVIPTLDGVTLVNGDRVLITTEATTSDTHNGIYDVTDIGSAGTPWILTRAEDADGSTPDGVVKGGMFVFIQEGTQFADTGWLLSSNGTINVDTDAQTFVQFSSAGTIQAGTGLTKVGNTLDVNAVGGAVGGTAIDLSVDSNNIVLDSADVVTQFSAGAATTFVQLTDNGAGALGIDADSISANISLNDGSGLTFDGPGDKYDLGGSLTQDAVLNYVVPDATDASIDFVMANTASSTQGAIRMNLEDTQVGVNITSNNTSGDIATLSVSENGATISNQVGANTQRIFLNGSTGGMQVLDQVNSRGLEYFADYSANYTNRSLVDKEYVDTQAGSQDLNNVLSQGGNIPNAADYVVTFDQVSNVLWNNGSGEWSMYFNGDDYIQMASEPAASSAAAANLGSFSDNTVVQRIGNASTGAGYSLDSVQNSGSDYMRFLVENQGFTFEVDVEDDSKTFKIDLNENNSAGGGVFHDFQMNDFNAGVTGIKLRNLVTDDQGNTNGDVVVNIGRDNAVTGESEFRVTSSYNDIPGGGSDNISESVFMESALGGGGLQYAADYSGAAGFGARSLVDKGYVDAAIVAATPAGIDDVLAQGQAITANRTITVGSNNLVTNATTSGTIDMNSALGQVLLYQFGGDFLVTDADATANVAGVRNIDIAGDTRSTFGYGDSTTWFSGGAKVISAGTDNPGFLVDDDLDSTGIRYAADYSAANAANDRWLVDKGYVDSAISTGSVTAGDGITDNSGTFNLGGTFTSSVALSGALSQSFGVDVQNSGGDTALLMNGNATTITQTDPGVTQRSILSMTLPGGNAFTTITAEAVATTDRTQVALSDGSLDLSARDAAGDERAIEIFGNANAIRITDNIDSIGMRYAADYSAANVANDRWLTDKGYVDSAITAATPNGIDDVLAQGQALTAAREITAGSNDFTITSDNTIDLDSLSVQLGDIGGNGNGTFIQIDDGDPKIEMVAGDFTIEINNGGSGQFIVTDGDGSPAGIEYAGDYSATFVARSLVDKGYVDAQVSGAALNFQEGLTESGGDVSLGGTFSSAIAITGDSDAAFSVTTDDGTDQTAGITIEPSGASSFVGVNTSGSTLRTGIEIDNDLGTIGSQLTYNPTASNDFKHFNVDASGIDMIFNDAANAQQAIGFDGTDMTVTDGINTKGLIYAADYSAAFVARSLVDKGYVDSEITANALSSGNGVTVNAGNIDLGGTLTSDVTIDGAVNFDLGSTVTPLTTMDIISDDITLTSGVPANNSGTIQITDGDIDITADETSGGGDAAINLTATSSTGGGNFGITMDAKNSNFNINNGAMQVAVVNNGLRYLADYSGTQTDRNLVDKGYVDSQITAANITAGNGITNNAGTFDLGGTLSAAIAFDGAESFTLGSTTELSNFSARTTGGANLEKIENGDNISGFIGTANGITLSAGGSAAQMLIEDNRGGTDATGIQYDSDYSANFTDRSLIDKGFLTTVASGQYGAVFVVDIDNGDNATAEVNSLTNTYLTINGAADAAETFVGTNGQKALVYVKFGTFSEANITRNKVDMYFERGTVVTTSTAGQGVLTDADNSFPTDGGEFNIYGYGTFAQLLFRSSDDSDTINLRKGTRANIEADDLGSVQVWNGATEARLTVKNAKMRFATQNGNGTNKYITYENCEILTPIHLDSFVDNRTGEVNYENCTFRLLSDYTYSNAAELWTITDAYNSTTIDYTDPATSTNGYLTDEQTGYTSSDTLLSGYTATDFRPTFTSIVEANITGTSEDLDYTFTNCKFILERDYTIAVLLLQNVATADMGVFFEGCTIEDRSTNGDTVGMVVSGTGVTENFKFTLRNTVADVTTLRKNYSTYNELKSSFIAVDPEFGGIEAGDSVLNVVSGDDKKKLGYDSTTGKIELQDNLVPMEKTVEFDANAITGPSTDAEVTGFFTATDGVYDWDNLNGPIRIFVNGLTYRTSATTSAKAPFWFSDALAGTKSAVPTTTLNRLFVSVDDLGFDLDTDDFIDAEFEIEEIV